MVSQQKPQFDSALIYFVHTRLSPNVCAMQGEKRPALAYVLRGCVLSAPSAADSPPPPPVPPPTDCPTLPSSPSGLCLADRTALKPKSVLRQIKEPGDS